LDIFLTEHFALRLQVYLWFPEFLKAEWEAEASVINQLPVWVQEAETFFTFEISDGSGDPETSHTSAAIGLHCWGDLP